jgi:hypothetical protein
MRFLTVAKFCSESGYTNAAVRGKINTGVWLEQRVWRRAPDGHILIDIEGYNEWVLNRCGLACTPRQKSRSSSSSHTKASGAARGLVSSPPPLI